MINRRRLLGISCLACIISRNEAWITTNTCSSSNSLARNTQSLLPGSSKNNYCHSRKSIHFETAKQHATTTSSQIFLYDKIPLEEIQNLPIYQILDSIETCMATKPNLLLEASPGAGKTTVVPLLLSSLPSINPHSSNDISSNNSSGNSSKRTFSNVIVVEPRRVATRSAAQRMASLIQQSSPGQSIGYAIRGESRVSAETIVTVMTDGVLLNKLRNDPELIHVDVVIFDEFHERGVGSDTALALCREVQANFRPDLKIVVMSATLLGGDGVNGNEDTDTSMESKLIRTLGGRDMCHVIRCDGREYPITIQHARRSSPLHGALLNDVRLLVKTMADAVEEGLRMAPSKGDVLAFLPGVKEIRRVMQELRDRNLDESIDILPLYGSLSKQEQDKAIRKIPGRRRVIVSSPIAEASLTIEGVTCVVDSGFQRQPLVDRNTGLPRLVTVACSKDSVMQRTGRAGRTESGHCIRLFTEGDFSRMADHAIPEILSSDLIPTTLLLADWGCTTVHEMIHDVPFVDPPPRDKVEMSYSLLVNLGALEEYYGNNVSHDLGVKITSHGKMLAQFPTHPRFASCIAKSAELGPTHLAAAVIVSAIMDEENDSRDNDLNLWHRVKKVVERGAASMDGKNILYHASRINAEAYNAVSQVFQRDIDVQQLIGAMGEALLPGFVDLVAQRKGDASYGSSLYKLSIGCTARLDGNQDEGEYIIVVRTSTGDDDKIRIRSYVRIDLETLLKVSEEVEEVYTVPSKGYEVRGRKVVKVGALELSSSPLPSPPPEKVTQILLQEIKTLGGVYAALIQNESKKKMEEITELRRRIRLASELSHEVDWPSCFAALDAMENSNSTAQDEMALISLIEPWLCGAGSLKNINILEILQSALDPEQTALLDRYFPTKIKAPDGSFIPLRYNEGSFPIATAKLQQFFGASESPKVGFEQNSIAVSLSLLSPSGKPLAKTMDLPFFWKEVYPDVRAEMRGRYPKHPWPEDPMTVAPTALSLKQLTKKSIEKMDDAVDDQKKKSKQKKKKR